MKQIHWRDILREPGKIDSQLISDHRTNCRYYPMMSRQIRLVVEPLAMQLDRTRFLTL